MVQFKAKATPIKLIIEEFFQQSEWSEEYNQHKLKEVWKSISGNLISKYTISIYSKADSITIHVANASLKAELHQNKTQWLERIQAELPNSNFKQIRIK